MAVLTIEVWNRNQGQARVIATTTIPQGSQQPSPRQFARPSLVAAPAISSAADARARGLPQSLDQQNNREGGDGHENDDVQN